MTTREKIVNTACKIVENHCAYIWGAQGEKLMKLSKEDIARMETGPANVEKVIRYINMLAAHGWLTGKSKAFDCSGLICYLLVKCGIEKPGFDMTADQLASRYPKRANLREGCLLHRKGHIGLYIGGGYLIEAKGRVWGVVVSPYTAADWDSVFPDPCGE